MRRSVALALLVLAALYAGACGGDSSSAKGDRQQTAADLIAAGYEHTAGLRADGTAVATGFNKEGQCDVSSWSDLVAVSAGGLHTVGLRDDGTAVATGFNDDGRCDVSSWNDLVAVSAGGFHTVGLRADGTAVATGVTDGGRCAVSPWKDLIAISAGGFHTVGLRADGTAVAVGSNEYGQCDTSSWRDLVAVSAGYRHTVGLRADGTVVATGDNEYGQCDLSSWKDLTAVSAGGLHTIGLHADGTAVATSGDDLGQGAIASWKDLVAVTAGWEHSVGLQADGSALAVGDIAFGQCDVSSWTLAEWPPPGSGSPSPAVSPSPSVSVSNGSGGSSAATTVYLLDGSGARESIISNRSWAAQIRRLGGPRVRARDLGGRNLTILQDEMLVDAMPKGKALVLIGVSLGRYAGDPTIGAEGYDPGAVLASKAEVNHQYGVSDVLSDGRKRRLVSKWLAGGLPVFRKTYAANAAELEKLVSLCQSRKLHPVLLELPLNREIAGKAFDEPQTTYQTSARKLAHRYDIPYIDFADDVGLVSDDFYDLMHLVEPGRVKWQKRLSVEVVALLKEYGIGQK